MAALTQNSTETLINAVISTILNNVNTGIRFFQACPDQAMRISLEETVIENLTFAELVATESLTGRYVLEKLKQMNNDIIDQRQVSLIELPKEDENFNSSMEEFLNGLAK